MEEKINEENMKVEKSVCRKYLNNILDLADILKENNVQFPKFDMAYSVSVLNENYGKNYINNKTRCNYRYMFDKNEGFIIDIDENLCDCVVFDAKAQLIYHTAFKKYQNKAIPLLDFFPENDSIGILPLAKKEGSDDYFFNLPEEHYYRANDWLKYYDRIMGILADFKKLENYNKVGESKMNRPEDNFHELFPTVQYLGITLEEEEELWK